MDPTRTDSAETGLESWDSALDALLEPGEDLAPKPEPVDLGEAEDALDLFDASGTDLSTEPDPEC